MVRFEVLYRSVQFRTQDVENLRKMPPNGTCSKPKRNSRARHSTALRPAEIKGKPINSTSKPSGQGSPPACDQSIWSRRSSRAITPSISKAGNAFGDTTPMTNNHGARGKRGDLPRIKIPNNTTSQTRRDWMTTYST